VVVVGLFLGLDNWKPIEWQPTLYLLAAAMFVSAGNMSIVKAYRIADPSAVSPFRYSVVIWAFLSGFVVFGEIPDVLAILGTGLIVASGIYTVHRERVRARQLTTQANLPV
jgi:drug/metabolite transporter (DMT)-like permease